MATTKINWTKARSDYIADPTISYADIARKYGVAKKTVEDHAKRDQWVAARQKIGDKAAAKAEVSIIDELASINTRHTQTYTLMQAIALENANILLEYIRTEKKAAQMAGAILSPKDLPSYQQFKFLAEAVDIGVKGERITKGMPTASPASVQLTGVVATVNLTPAQRESLVNATSIARDIIEAD